MTEKNWAGNYTFGAGRVHRPTSIDELLHLVGSAGRIRAVGSRHSFTGIADSEELVSLEAVPARFEVAPDRSTATTGANVTYRELTARLRPHGLAVHNLASLPHVTVAGAIATGTHGSGDGNGNLATSVAAVELATSSGEIITATRGDPDFDGLVVSMGSVGVVTAVTLDVVPSFEIRQFVIEDVPWEALEESFDAVFSSGYSVSAFDRFGPSVEQLWIKQLVDAPVGAETFGGRPATVDRHPLIELPAENCTAQLGRPGPWSDRLPHFRADIEPNAGEEIQSEFFVARADAAPAIGALRAVGDRLAPALMVNEIRTIAADELWMSPHYRRHSVAFHFTWWPDPAAAQAAVEVVESALAPFDPRPHWGKVFTPEAFPMADLYQRRDDFVDLVHRFDQRQAFNNHWFERVIGR